MAPTPLAPLLLLLLSTPAAAAGHCLVDKVQDRQLPHQVCLVTGGCEHLTIRWCAQQCRAGNFEIAGVEAGHQCCCGHRLTNASATAPSTECNKTCTGNSSETCGGMYRLWAFDPSQVPPPPPPPATPSADPRWIPNGDILRTGGYSCQPYCAVLPNGTWSCVMTFIHAPIWVEGSPGEHMISLRTDDQGKTWRGFNAIEPYSNESTGQVSAYGSVTARKDGSRLFAVWIQNVNNVSHLPGQKPRPSFRADMLGKFVWKFSDDQGLTWSSQHYEIPVPFTYIESINSFSVAKGGDGKTQIMWQVDHLKTMRDGTLVFAFTKIGTYAVAAPEEIYILASPNILTEQDPTKVQWNIYPRGQHGISAVGHPDDPNIITEEPHVVPIYDDQVLYVCWRTNQGYMGATQSQRLSSNRSFADPWDRSTFASYLPTWADNVSNASWLKHPRGPLSPKRQPNGWVLMTFYNTEPLGKFASHMEISDRSHMWLTAGRESGGTLKWTQPELVLYDRDRTKGHGYPDIITDDGNIFITETFKSSPMSEAKTHHVSNKLLELLFSQTTLQDLTTEGQIARLNRSTVHFAPGVHLPNFYTFPTDRYGLSIDIIIDSRKVIPSKIDVVSSAAIANKFHQPVWTQLISALSTNGQGIELAIASNGTIRFHMQDQNGKIVDWSTDPTCSMRLADIQDPISGSTHHVGVLVDAGPNMISFVVDGKLCDGGPNPTWPNGHLLFDQQFGDVGTGVTSLNVNTSVVADGRVYNRTLYVSELIGNWRSRLLV